MCCLLSCLWIDGSCNKICWCNQTEITIGRDSEKTPLFFLTNNYDWKKTVLLEGKGGIPFRLVDLIATQQPSNIAMIHEVGQWQWHFKDNTSKVCSHVEDKKSTERKNMGTKSVKPKETRLLFVALLYIFAMFLKQKNWENKTKKQRYLSDSCDPNKFQQIPWRTNRSLTGLSLDIQIPGEDRYRWLFTSKHLLRFGFLGVPNSHLLPHQVRTREFWNV